MDMFHHDLVNRYGISVLEIIMDMFHHDLVNRYGISALEIIMDMFHHDLVNRYGISVLEIIMNMFRLSHSQYCYASNLRMFRPLAHLVKKFVLTML